MCQVHLKKKIIIMIIIITIINNTGNYSVFHLALR